MYNYATQKTSPASAHALRWYIRVVARQTCAGFSFRVHPPTPFRPGPRAVSAAQLDVTAPGTLCDINTCRRTSPSWWSTVVVLRRRQHNGHEQKYASTPSYEHSQSAFHSRGMGMQTEHAAIVAAAGGRSVRGTHPAVQVHWLLTFCQSADARAASAYGAHVVCMEWRGA